MAENGVSFEKQEEFEKRRDNFAKTDAFIEEHNALYANG